LEDWAYLVQGNRVLIRVLQVILALLQQTFMHLMIRLAFCGSREIHVDLGALSNILKSQVQDLLKIAVRQQVLWVWAFTHPIQMMTLRIGLVPEIGHVPL
jgi:hypothetical protein